MRIPDVRRIDFGTFVRPAEETETRQPRVEAVYGYLVRSSAGLLLVDTGLGKADQETEAWYGTRRIPVTDALRTAGVAPEQVSVVVNCHLHFGHIGGNPLFARQPIRCQRRELEMARAGGYTVDELVDFEGVRYELLDGEAEIVSGVYVIPTPGHVDGHRSLVVECDDGSIVLAGQAHGTASEWSADVLAERAGSLGHEPRCPHWESSVDSGVPRSAQRSGSYIARVLLRSEAIASSRIEGIAPSHSRWPVWNRPVRDRPRRE